jgi:hypothetical protein
MKRTMLFVAFTVLATVASAHQDLILSVRPDGVIPELPPAYEAARLRIVFSEGEEGALQQLDFLSSGRETNVQPCLLRMVPKGSFRQIFLIGSWYHNERGLPHYVQVQFLDSAYPREWPNLLGLPKPFGVRFLFSLRDASLLEVTQVVPLASGAPQRRDIRLSNGCPA